MSMTLYEINKSIEELLENLVDEETGEVDEEKLDELNQLNVDRNEKIENCILYAKSMKADAEAIQRESDALKKRAMSKLNRAENTLKYVEMCLGGEKFETDKCAVSYRTSQAVEILNEELIPDELCVYKTERKPSKADIKKLLKSGKEVKGAVLVERKNMQIK